MPGLTVVDVVGVGLNAIDTLIRLPHYPVLGSKIEICSANVLPGGQVASAMVACQHWGLRTRYVGKLGDDGAARLHRAEFARVGVEARLITAPGYASQQAFILVDDSGERTVLWNRDASLALRPEDLDREWVVNARALHVDGHDTPAATIAAEWARSAGIPVIADVDDLYPGVEALFEKIDYLIVSRDIPGRLLSEHDLRKSLPMMQRRHGCLLTAATLGRDGVLAWDGTKLHYAAAYLIEAVDTTGAGDIFHAGFIYGLLQGWPLQLQLDFACAAAALNCTAVGARGGIGSVESIKTLMAEGARYVAAYQV
ncbi:MAG TPA: PfkB family carbohydrate kinase [Terriglobales bacterium]|nr:PfkB family carbohydrate kinase [Terriglobales bacterium]HXY47847.1 PfkB family carbohydrate kinase [Terriglobales bacterium]